MGKIGIVTDTDASLPAALAEQYDVRLVPINIHFGEAAFRSEVDIDDAILVRRVKEAGAMPTTSAPTPGQFVEAYAAALDDGYESIACFTVSSEISTTYNAARQAAELIPDADIRVVDSRTVSMGQGFMAVEAARLAQQGLSLDEVIAGAQTVRGRTSLYAALDTLTYLAMSGRVGHIAAGMASVLSIKPVLTLREGKLDMLEKVRTRRKAWRRVVELTAEDLADRDVVQMAILHVDAPDAAADFEAALRERMACPVEVTMAPFTAGLSVHTGPGMVGVVAVAEG